MKGGHHPDVFALEPFTTVTGDTDLRAEGGFGSRAAKQHDNPGTDQGRLIAQERHAGIHFFRERSTVHGWTAFDNIADVDPVPGQGYGRKHLGEELSRRADESESLFIFRLAGTFADEHEGRVDISLTGHFVLDPLTERTAAAVLNQFIKFLPASRLHSDSSFLTARHQAA